MVTQPKPRHPHRQRAGHAAGPRSPRGWPSKALSRAIAGRKRRAAILHAPGGNSPADTLARDIQVVRPGSHVCGTRCRRTFPLPRPVLTRSAAGGPAKGGGGAPPSVRRPRMRARVRRLTPGASQTCLSVQRGSPGAASPLSSIRTCVSVEVAARAVLTSLAKVVRSSSVSVTTNLSGCNVYSRMALSRTRDALSREIPTLVTRWLVHGPRTTDLVCKERKGCIVPSNPPSSATG